MKFKTLGGVGLMLMAVLQPAHADMVGDCNQSRSSQMRIYACTEIIEGAAFSTSQKARAYRNRAVSRADAGATEQAIADFNEAIRLHAKNPAAFDGRGRAKLTRDDIDGAINDFDSAIAQAPNTARFFIGRGYAYLLKGLPDPAISDFTKAIQLNPKSASALNHRGLAYRKKGDLDRAIKDYTAAIALNPVYALAYNNRGYVHEARGDKDKAIADFRKALLFDRSLVGAADGLKRLQAAGPLASESDDMIRQGKALVEDHCSRCHAVGLTGESPNAKAPQFRSLQTRHPKLTLREPLSRGIAAPHDEMPRFALADSDVDKIIAYVNSLPDTGK